MSAEWKDSFETFLRDMGNKPSPEYSIERIDTDGMYSLQNCKWIPLDQQAKNKRTNVLLSLNGQTHTAADWARIVGIKYQTLLERLKRGWPVEKALHAPLDQSRKKKPVHPKNLQAPPL